MSKNKGRFKDSKIRDVKNRTERRENKNIERKINEIRYTNTSELRGEEKELELRCV